MENITRDQIIKAINRIDENPESLSGRSSSTYDLLYQEKPYPPILVLSEANKLAGGEELFLRNFDNNIKEPFQILENHGFLIVPKEKANIASLLRQFISQADEQNDLKTKSYPTSFLDTKLKISFGQGNFASIPWIGFLLGNNTIQHGIYPVYLYYKEHNIIILAYGISETHKPDVSWHNIQEQSIKSYFLEKFQEKPKRYEESMIFKIYDPENMPAAEVLQKDIEEIIDQYKEIMQSQVRNEHSQLLFEEKMQYSSLNPLMNIFNPLLVTRFISSLQTKPFVLLTGLSGSGKTRLALTFAQWICENKSQYCLVPVGADWINREPLLGYVNALDPNNYVLPENGALQFIIEANENQDKPYFLILDEMNLSHVERYFADFLSIMESRQEFQLHASDIALKSGEISVDKSYVWPPNLFVIGTVNIDETTYMFSPKVLDRANVIEFRVDTDDLENFLKNPVPLTDFNGEGAAFAASFLENAKQETIADDNLKSELLNFFGTLKEVGAEFGYRSANEIIKLYDRIGRLDSNLSSEEKTDVAIMQKLLPKLHGSRRKLAKPLTELAKLCLVTIPETDIFTNEGKSNVEVTNIKYPLSFGKIQRMYQSLIENSFASYAEA